MQSCSQFGLNLLLQLDPQHSPTLTFTLCLCLHLCSLPKTHFLCTPSFITPSYLPGTSLIRPTPRTQILFTMFLYCSEQTSACLLSLLNCLTGSYVCILIEGELHVNGGFVSLIFSLQFVHSRYKCIFSNRSIKEGTSEYKYEHAVLILSPLLKFRLNSSFISSKKPSQLLQTTLQRQIEEGGILYSQWDTLLHLHIFYFTCVNSAHTKT